MLQKNYVIGKNKLSPFKILAFIPARSGSKSIKDKNIRKLNNKPLLAWSIETCKKSKYLKDIIVSTDSKKYAKIAKKFGVEKVVLRPKKISGDKSTDLQAILHLMKTIKNFDYSFIAHIRPTTPLRDVNEIDKAIKFFLNCDFSSLRSVHEMPESAYKTYEIKKKNLLQSIGRNKKIDFHSVPRQKINKTYAANGVIDIYRTSNILKKKNLFGNKIYAFKTKFTYEVDSIHELKILSTIMKK